MSNASAWVMRVGEALYASVSQMELVHIVNSPGPVEIPATPSHCNSIIVWNENILPVVDLAVLLGSSNTQNGYDAVAVTIYRDSEENINYGGIRLFGSPELEHVDNGQVCSLPAFPELLRSISISCFLSKSGHEVPILDMSRIFSRELPLAVTS